MLSNAMRNLATHLAQYKDTGMVLESASVAAIMLLLETWANEAARLEGAANPDIQGHGLPEDVVKIATVLAKKGVSAGLPEGWIV